MLNLIFFGAPGAGKGTQAKMLASQYNLQHISTGDLLRIEVTNQTTLGRTAKTFMDKGELVPDEIIIAMVENIVKDIKTGFILDGFPRTLPQAKALDMMLDKYKIIISKVIFLDVPKEELIVRMSKRAQIEGRQDDKDISAIENRINVYNDKTKPLLDYYKNQAKLITVQGVGSIEDIYKNIVESLR